MACSDEPLRVLLFVAAGIDRRLGWSEVFALVVAVADVVVVPGFVIVFLTFQANSHAAAIVDVTPDQRVVSTGPYALVRHPMYLGGALVVLATPFALGSAWAFPWALAAVGCLAVAARRRGKVPVAASAGLRRIPCAHPLPADPVHLVEAAA
jgi:protein-S-isoprenylcysteine O-methyltransferase Ste14